MQDLGHVGRKTGKWIEAAVEFEIAVRSVEIRMIENVERVGLKLQGEALLELNFLHDREIEPRLKGSAEDVSAIAAIAGFRGVANGCSHGSRPARRNSTLARLERRDREVVWIDIGNPDLARGRSREISGIVGSTLGSLFRRDSWGQRKNRIRYEVVSTEENAGGSSREINDAKRLAALSYGNALNPPTIHYVVDELRRRLEGRKLIHIANCEHMRAVEI